MSDMCSWQDAAVAIVAIIAIAAVLIFWISALVRF